MSPGAVSKVTRLHKRRVRVNLAVLGLPGREGRLELKVFLAFSLEGTASSLPPMI